MVRTERLELSHLSAPEPKSGASTNSATFALRQAQHYSVFSPDLRGARRGANPMPAAAGPHGIVPFGAGPPRGKGAWSSCFFERREFPVKYPVHLSIYQLI